MKRQSNSARTIEIAAHAPTASTEQRVPYTRGHLEGMSPGGDVIVRIGSRVVPAEVAVACGDAELLLAIRERREVLLAYIDGDPNAPAIAGFLRRGLARQRNAVVSAEAARDRFIELEATHGIAIRSGTASIELHADGRIELRGVEITSIADGTNRLIGARVAVN